jgi:multimeric flavodoxin WrbA
MEKETSPFCFLIIFIDMIKLKDILKEEGYFKSNDYDVNRPQFSILRDTISYLSNNGGRTLLLTTSTRYPFNTEYDRGGVESEMPKSTELALFIKENIPNVVWIDVPQVKIYPCEGNVSHKSGNSCGVLAAKLNDRSKNPTGNHRCWASVNDKEDELWKISKEIFKADTVIFFSSIRWGQTNAEYQKLIERLTWLENRHSTLGEDNLLEGKKAGFICVGQNWNGANVVQTQKEVLSFFGFDTPDNLFWNWQYTDNKYDESQESYRKAHDTFHVDLGIPLVQIEIPTEFKKKK